VDRAGQLQAALMHPRQPRPAAMIGDGGSLHDVQEMQPPASAAHDQAWLWPLAAIWLPGWAP